MRTLLLPLAALSLLAGAPLAQTWTQIPLPPGVTQWVETELTYGAEFPLALTDSGAHLWEFRAGAWQPLPLPAGLAAIGGGTGSRMLPAGTRPLVSTDYDTVLREWDGSNWGSIPLPPGATMIGGSSGVEMLDCGARPLATTNFGTSLFEWDGATWNTLPLPPGEAGISSAMSAVSAPGGSQRHLVSVGYGAGLVEWDGAAWVSVPLPPGASTVGGGSSTQLEPRALLDHWHGRAGANLTVTTNSGAGLLQWHGGTWLSVPMPAGIDLTPASGNHIARGSRSLLLLSANSGQQLWALYDPTVDVEASSLCAGGTALHVLGEPMLGETFTLSMTAPLASWFTGISLTPPVSLPMCSCPGLLDAVWIYGAQPLPVPQAPQLLGAEIYAQGLDFLPGAMSCSLPPPAALTDVLRLVIG